MTPVSAGRVPQGPWEFAYIDGEYEGIWSPAGKADGTPDIYCYPDGGPPDEPTGLERLMLAACNACWGLNPTDPLSAAQHIEALVKAARQLLKGRSEESAAGDYVYLVPQNVHVDALEAALSAVTGKP